MFCVPFELCWVRSSGVHFQTVAKLERVYCMYDCVGVEKGSVLCQ